MPIYPTYFPTVGSGTACQNLAMTETWPQWVYRSYEQVPTYQPVGTQYAIWVDWNTTAGTNIQPIASNHQANVFDQGIGYAAWNTQVVSPEQVKTNERRAARDRMIAANRGRARWMRRRVAERRAEALLLEFLDPTQRQEWLESKAKSSTPHFHVITKGGVRKYKIKYGLAGNIVLAEAKEAPVNRHGVPIRVGARFCAHVYHPEGWVPDADNVLAQKLLLEAEGGEDQFLAMANVS